MPATLIRVKPAPIDFVAGKSLGMAVRSRPVRRCTWFILGSSVLALMLSGCTIGQPQHGEAYELSTLRVVFLDASQIQAKYEEITGQSAVMTTPRLALETQRGEEVVVGFYDFRTQTIYCPKMDFEVCGHELHHAVLGHFHLHQ